MNLYLFLPYEIGLFNYFHVFQKRSKIFHDLWCKVSMNYLKDQNYFSLKSDKLLVSLVFNEPGNPRTFKQVLLFKRIIIKSFVQLGIITENQSKLISFESIIFNSNSINPKIEILVKESI